MDPLSFRQFKFIGLATHRVQNLKSLKELRLQLPIAFDFDIFAVQPNFLTRSVTFRLNSFIVGSFLQLLGLLQVLSLYSHEIPKFLGQLISCFELGAGVDVFFVKNTWVVPVVELERHVPHASVSCIIISKFYHGQKPRLVVLFIINEDSKISFYCAVLPLSLAIGLRVKGSRKPPFDA